MRAKLERTRELLSNKLPLGVVLEDVLDAALECYLEKHAPERRAARRSARAAKKVEDTEKKEDQSTLDTPTRSSSIRILCSAHNQLMADKILGEPFMRAKRYADSTDFGASTG